MGWLGVGRPEQPRKSSSRREERHDQREAMRASRDSNTWGQQQGMASPVGSTTGTHHPHGERPHLGTSSSRRVSHTRTSSRGRSQQPSPLTSPRQQSSVSHPYGNNNGYGGSYQQQPSYAQHSMQQQQHIQTQDSSGSAYGAQGAPGPGSQGGMLDRVRQAVQTFAGGGGSSGGVGAGGSGQLRSGSKGAPGQQQQQQQQHLQESASAAAAAEQVRELQHRIQSMEAQVNEVEQVKQKLLAEQRVALDWKEKWNFQNFKLNVMLDMLVLQAMEHEGGGGGGAGGAGQLASAATLGRPLSPPQQAHAAGGLVGVGRQASSRRGEALVEEEYDG